MIVLCQGSNPKAPFFPPSLSDDKAVARRGKWTDCDSQAGSIPACHIVQFSDRTQLAMTPSDTGRASSNRRINFVALSGSNPGGCVEAFHFS